jgi:hypothetical protein
MEISILSLLEGATRATGTVAIIDVFRAFTTAAVALANGASSIVMVRSAEEALALRDAGIGQICMGEVQGRAPDGFDFGNSPFEVSGVDFHGKTIIQRTSAGTQGIVAASRADRLYAASLVTADATARALVSDSPDRISRVGMMDSGLKRTDEDELCSKTSPALGVRHTISDGWWSLEVESTGTVADFGIFQPEPEKGQKPPIACRFFNLTVPMRQPTISADREDIKQPPEPGMRHRTPHYEKLVCTLKPEARLAGALVDLDPRRALTP